MGGVIDTTKTDEYMCRQSLKSIGSFGNVRATCINTPLYCVVRYQEKQTDACRNNNHVKSLLVVFYPYISKKTFNQDY